MPSILARPHADASRKTSTNARVKGDFFAKRRKVKATKVFESEKDNASAHNFGHQSETQRRAPQFYATT
jgi:hypothetical protein